MAADVEFIFVWFPNNIIYTVDSGPFDFNFSMPGIDEQMEYDDDDMDQESLDTGNDSGSSGSASDEDEGGELLTFWTVNIYSVFCVYSF